MLALFAPASPAAAAEPDALATLNRIRYEAFERSQVHAYALELADRYGPRLTNSPNHRASAEWVKGELEKIGLAGARIEPFDFGRGWSFGRCEVRMTSPAEVPLLALPKAWTPGTAGAVRGRAVRVDLETPADLEAQRGKLAGTIVLLDAAGKGAEERAKLPVAERWSDTELAEMLESKVPVERMGAWLKKLGKEWTFGRQRDEFLVAEGVLATAEVSSRENGVVRGDGSEFHRDPERPAGVPGLYFAAEPYQRILRLLAADTAVELELEVDARFQDQDLRAPNVVAELPGRDKSGEVVMTGAHLDSWHLGTGAVDDGAGVAVVMEAMRILGRLGVAPRRTIRVALWGGEEQGLLGSRAWVERHIVERDPVAAGAGDLSLPPAVRSLRAPFRAKGEHGKISAYFNLDYGSGRIRGIYTLGNVAAGAVFEEWIRPLADLGVSTVTNNPIPIGGSDHSAFDRSGVPGFMFLQDPLDYFHLVHHSNLDTADHLRRDDLVQASIVVAHFLWEAANRGALLPRKPMPEAALPGGSRPSASGR